VSADCVQSCVTPVAVQGFVQCVPVAAPAPVPARVPLPPAGLNRWAIAGIVAGAGAGAAVAATAGEEGAPIPPTVVSPTRP
jgi:hypothetical protein